MNSSLPNLEHLVPGAKTIVETCLRVGQDESVAVLVDTPNSRVGMALEQAVAAVGGEPVIMMFSPRSAHGEDPPAAAASALAQADAGILATSYSLASSQARLHATEAGVRIITIPGCSEAVFTSPAMLVDFAAMRPRIEQLGAMLTQSQHVHLTTAAGTDLHVALCGRRSIDQTGLAHRPGTWSPFPNIETAVGPKDDGISGVFVADGVLIPGGVPAEPARVEIENGRVVNVTGGADAKTFRQLLDSYDDPNIKQVVELGFGLNPKSQVGRGLMAEDESQWGTVHLGIGEGRTFGLVNPAPAHMDIVALAPTVAFDGQVILDKGTYQIEGFEDDQPIG